MNTTTKGNIRTAWKITSKWVWVALLQRSLHRTHWEGDNCVKTYVLITHKQNSQKPQGVFLSLAWWWNPSPEALPVWWLCGLWNSTGRQQILALAALGMAALGNLDNESSVLPSCTGGTQEICLWPACLSRYFLLSVFAGFGFTALCNKNSNSSFHILRLSCVLVACCPYSLWVSSCPHVSEGDWSSEPHHK